MAQALRAAPVACPFAGLLQSCETNALRGSKASLEVKQTYSSFPVRAENSGRTEEQKVHSTARLGFSIITSSLVVGNGGAALAVTAEEVAGAFNTVEDVSSQVAQTAGSFLVSLKEVFQQIFIKVKPAIDVAVPFVQQTTDAALKAAAPVANDLGTQAENALQKAGVDPKPVLDAAKTAVMVAGEATGKAIDYIEDAEPYALTTFENILASDPLLLVGGAGALGLVYLLAPLLFSSVAYSSRGYKGDLTAAQALDLLSKGNYFLIDVRTEKEKSKAGIPSLPRNAKSKVLFVPVEEFDGKLRGQLRDVRKVEAEVAALKISSLKKFNKGSKLALIDSSGDVSKIVARALTNLGFKNTWVILDGFGGGKGWVQSKLGTETYNSAVAEVLSPSRILPPGTRFFSRSSSNNDAATSKPRQNRLLPGRSDK